MGQKVNPIGFRIAITRDWRSKWYASKADCARFILEDYRVREFLKKKLASAAVPKILIERASSRIRITIFTARPGIVIGRKGTEIDKLKEEISRITGNKEIYVDISEVKTPELDAQLVAENIAHQLERRIAFRRAIKSSSAATMRAGAKGVRIEMSGRLNGAEMSRREKEVQGSVPLHTLRADIDYAQVGAKTPTGIIGIKVWIYKGEIFDLHAQSQEQQPAAKSERAGGK